MKICFISDTHNHHDKINLPTSDILIHSGDVSSGTLEEIETFLIWFNKQKAKYKILIAGNQDIAFEKSPSTIKVLLNKYSNIIYLENSETIIKGIKFYGAPQVPRFRDKAFNVDRGEEIKKFWDKIPDDVDILITHGPPHGILDFSWYDQKSVGCEELALRVKQIKPTIHVFGHIHEEYSIIQDEDTTYINASICTRLYKPTNRPHLIKYKKKTKKIKILNYK